MNTARNLELLSHRTAVLLVVMLRIAEEKQHEFDSSHFFDMHKKALSIAHESLNGDVECLELVKQAGALYEQQNVFRQTDTRH